mmetsp:Transcript_14660/g.24979  ORF Transcript_14660/g.24979 Transcript_14660/m.24979 type:complete len:122 (+) Transcript_14660:526-891(+)
MHSKFKDPRRVEYSGAGFHGSQADLFEEKKESGLEKAQSKIGMVTSLMKQNLGNMLNSNAQLGDIENQSVKLAGTAQRFREHSQQLERQSRCRNLQKLACLAVFLSVFVLVLYYFSPTEIE